MVFQWHEQVHPRRSRATRQRPRQRPRRAVLHPPIARQGRGAMRQEVRRGGGRSGAGGGQRGPRACHRGVCRRALSPLGHAAGARREACRDRSPAGNARQEIRLGREGFAVAHAQQIWRMNLSMEQRTEDGLSPYRTYTRAEWAALRDDMPMTLMQDEVNRLRSLHDRLDMKEVEDIYLTLSRLLSLYVAATQRLHRAQQRFLGSEEAKVPYVIGVAGSVAVGKSTTARVLQALLARWTNVPKVDLITTDGFLLPNAVLEREGLMEKKGFPESYDLPALLLFLSDVKAGRRPVRAPIYSHLVYDVMPNQWVEIDRPDILIVEGLNVLQTGRLPKDGKAIPFVSDFFDFSVYLDADEDVLKAWYVDRFLTLRGTAFRDPKSYFHRYSNLSDEAATETAASIWSRINLVNLHENILPTRQRADLILKKGESHMVEDVALRKL